MMPTIQRPKRNMKDSKIAIMGGSFDPVHLGHLFLLHTALTLTDYRTIILIPAKVSNFKQSSRPCASDEDRLEMLKLSLEDFFELYPQHKGADIRISDMELKRGGVSYTSDTVKLLKGQNRLGIILGDDHIEGLTRWHDYDYLKDNVEYLICRRESSESCWKSLPKEIVYQRLEPQGLAPQSSSAIRTQPEVREGFLSKRVMNYVTDKNLYN